MLVEKRLCMNCQQNVATIKFTRLVNGNVEEQFLCQPCAAAKSPYQKKAMPHLDEILSGILGAAAAEAATSVQQQQSSTELVCSTCGLPFASYRETLILGCSDCYQSFEKLLVNDLNRFHRATNHTGRVPHGQAQQVENYRNNEDIKRRLAEAVRVEDFKLAAKLRDQLRELEAEETTEASKKAVETKSSTPE